MTFGVTSAESTDLFVGPPDAALQVVRVGHTGGTSPIIVEGDGVSTPEPPSPDPAGGVAEVPVEVVDPVPGQRRAARVLCDGASTEFEFVVAEPGWTMFMISHFHYDPVWWNTQAAYTSLWTEEPPGRCRQTNGLNLVTAHLEMARREPQYKFVLAEVDYL
ncbi:MAG: glycoside hydrolase family 38 N-terminal domain-containing protein, partial [Mycobacterium sp.]